MSWLAAVAWGATLTACAAQPARLPLPAASDRHEEARSVLTAFVTAAEGQRFDECYRLLAGPWRARYTPERLARDFRTGGQAAGERLARARAAAIATPSMEGGRAAFPIGGDRSVRLVREQGEWRVESLD